MFKLCNYFVLLYVLIHSISCACIHDKWVLEAILTITVNYPITETQSDECVYVLEKNIDSSINITGYGLNIYMSENTPDDRKIASAAVSVYNDTIKLRIYSSYSDDNIIENRNNNANYTIQITCLNNECNNNKDKDTESDKIDSYINTVIDMGSCVTCLHVELRPGTDNFSPRVATVSSFTYRNEIENTNAKFLTIGNVGDDLNFEENCKNIKENIPVYLCYKQ
ncbi:ER localized, inhibits NF-kappaB activation [Yokapox virus]|uniref:Early protein OPG038 n=1 Tax=Yokapox virus TaxID=1076255 RepID=G3EI67_9POXV|nr:ER localized, inhibits NF-kappaB activation [Yokapox virus]AEN03764.1 ER localized, inhibits NF-kappaB activation [Yokapox virus]